VSPDTKIYVCEPETGAPVTAALANDGVPAPVEFTPSFVDGAGSGSLLPDMWERARPLVAGSFPISLDATAAAVRLLLERGRIVAEGAAALPVAAALSGSAGHGALLLTVYSAGLAIPFLLTSVAFTRMTTLFAVVKRHYPVIMAVGGAILIVFGVSILTGWFDTFNRWAQDLLDSIGINWSSEI
jgi:threonine dehydratase